jgi:hypothetical protein
LFVDFFNFFHGFCSHYYFFEYFPSKFQRFFVNDGFYNGTVRSGDDKVLLSKNILFVGGPSALRSDIVVNEALPHVEVAKKLGARLWALEVRFSLSIIAHYLCT